jgi:prolyl 4-hydroxylase
MKLQNSILKGCCPDLAVIDVATKMAGFSLPASEIALKGVPRSFADKFTLLRVVQILKELGVEAAGYRVDPVQLKTICSPIIAQAQHNGAQEFAVIARMDGDSVVSFSGTRGWMMEAADIFVGRSSGFYLSIDKALPPHARAAATPGEPDDFDLRLIDNFLTDEECRDLIEECGPRFSRSMVSADGSLKTEAYSLGRTSKTAFCQGRTSTAIVRRAAILIGASPTAFEDVQCITYEPGNKFSPHYDAPIETPLGERPARAWTMLAYLNDGFAGGETFFPLLDLKVVPKKGGLLLFRNRRMEDGDVDGRSLHAGLPVESGVKYACNIWCADSGTYPLSDLVRPRLASVGVSAIADLAPPDQEAIR